MNQFISHNYSSFIALLLETFWRCQIEIILKFSAVLNFSADDLRFLADVNYSHFVNSYSTLWFCQSTNFIKGILSFTATYWSFFYSNKIKKYIYKRRERMFRFFLELKVPVVIQWVVGVIQKDRSPYFFGEFLRCNERGITYWV